MYRAIWREDVAPVLVAVFSTLVECFVRGLGYGLAVLVVIKLASVI